jgi:predicted TIM-barrel fold metal-dependent hydrolase
MTLPPKNTFSFSGACDCHLHIVGPISRFPQSADRHYTAGLAAVETLRALAEPTGVSRFVLVQPSFYGMDNSCVLETLDGLNGNGRGVVVIDPAAVTLAQLEEYKRRGACGVRLNFYSKVSPLASAGFSNALQKFMKVLPCANWHAEVIATLPTLVSVAEAIRHSTLPIVIDHYGLPEDATPDSDLGRILLDLLRLPHVWMKLSAPYRVVHNPVATVPPSEWLAALLEVAPDRCVWGSDWPYAPPRKDQTDKTVTIPFRNIDYAQALADFIEALPDPALAERILVLNPQRLYGFGAAQTAPRGSAA